MPSVIKYSTKRLTATLKTILNLLGMSMDGPTKWPEFRKREAIEEWAWSLRTEVMSRSEAYDRYTNRDLRVTTIRRYKDDSRSQHEFLVAEVKPTDRDPVYVRVERSKDMEKVSGKPSASSAHHNSTPPPTQHSDIHPAPTNDGSSNTNTECSAMLVPPAPQKKRSFTSLNLSSLSLPGSKNRARQPDASTQNSSNNNNSGHEVKAKTTSSAHLPHATLQVASVASSSTSSLSSIKSHLAHDIITTSTSWPVENDPTAPTSMIGQVSFQNTTYYDFVNAAMALHTMSLTYTLFNEQCYWYAGLVLQVLKDCDPGSTVVDGITTGVAGTWFKIPIQDGKNYVEEAIKKFISVKEAFDKDILEHVDVVKTNKKLKAEVADTKAEIADKNAEIVDKNAEIADKNAEIADKDAEVGRQTARADRLEEENRKLRAQLAKRDQGASSV